jgi:hypothetical protein
MAFRHPTYALIIDFKELCRIFLFHLKFLKLELDGPEVHTEKYLMNESGTWTNLLSS